MLNRVFLRSFYCPRLGDNKKGQFFDGVTNSLYMVAKGEVEIYF